MNPNKPNIPAPAVEPDELSYYHLTLLSYLRESHLFTATAQPEMEAYEKDLLTERILRQLRPGTDVRVQGFEELPPQDNGRFDVAASNIPFGDRILFLSSPLPAPRISLSSQKSIKI